MLFPYSIRTGGLLALACLLLSAHTILAGSDVRMVKDADGMRLVVDGEDFLVKGVNWSYVPIGQNYSYSLWNQPEPFIREALDEEMPLLKAMGVNTIRQYVGIPPRWIEYIYREYGIHTVLNHALGRYGMTIDGVWTSPTDYGDPRTREVILAEIREMIETYQGTPGLLIWLLGNENNYGLYWSSAETEDLPEEELHHQRAVEMYSLFEEAIGLIKQRDTRTPVSMANGDLQYLDIIVQQVPSLDIYGTNMYRGISFGDAFSRVMEEAGWPILFTEFGCDAFHAVDVREDQYHQAAYLLGQWQEIYQNTQGKGLAGNSLGGLTFQWSDGWWKYLQEENLDVHDINASWANGGYPYDLAPGENNMNEEWWGVCAKGPTLASGHFQLYPRAAYYALQEVNRLDPYAGSSDRATIDRHFADISPMAMLSRARGDKADLAAEDTRRFRVSGLRMKLETISTGGKRIQTPSSPDEEYTGYPRFRGFDRLESFFVDFEAQPAGNMTGQLSLNILGNVPENPIDETFYENRERPVKVLGQNGWETISGTERVSVYRASVSWKHRDFDLEGFYRGQHYHWGYEGDFFGLYREANYGPNIDMYNGNAPIGMELTARRSLKGLVIAMGPELWWGANPTILAKYRRELGSFGPFRDLSAAVVVQKDLADQKNVVSSSALPTPQTRKATLHLQSSIRDFGLELGAIWAGQEKVGRTFTYVDDSGQPTLDEIRPLDTFGGKFKLTWGKGRVLWYAQGALMGLVADGGPTAVQTYTGWLLKDSGMGNQVNALTGLTWSLGNLQVAPNVLWQKPIEGPNPSPWLRNVVVANDPFAVGANRETVAAELLLSWDPTPATWMYAWNNDMVEDARLAWNLGLVVRRHETGTDAGQYFAEDGETIYAYDASTPARDLWEIHSRIVAKRTPGHGVIANLYAGLGEANGDFAGEASIDREIRRWGGDARLIWNSVKTVLSARVNDWGPYDYHRDFNYTYPLQLGADLSTSLGKPQWWDEMQSRLGVRVLWRSLDKHSNRYCPAMVLENNELVCDPDAPGHRDGREWEIRTYLHLGI